MFEFSSTLRSTRLHAPLPALDGLSVLLVLSTVTPKRVEIAPVDSLYGELRRIISD